MCASLPNYQHNALSGWRIVVCSTYETKVKRTWKERLFSRPWQPFITHKSEFNPLLPDGEILINNAEQLIYCNERTKQSLELALSIR